MDQSITKREEPRPQRSHHASEFESRAQKKQELLMKTHEFRRKSVKEFEVPQKDYFEYDEADKRRFELLGFQQLFKQPVTYKSIRWALFVGGLFGCHRYYRTRDILNAMHWTSMMSMFSFFNIWLSYSFQQLMPDYSYRKARSQEARNQMRRHRYEDYYVQTEMKLHRAELSPDDTPIFSENALESLEQFQLQVVKYAAEKTLKDTPEARRNKRNITLGDVLQDSRTGGSAARLRECLEMNRNLKIPVQEDPNLLHFQE